MKLMLVEDEYLLNKTIKTYLELRGFKVDGYLDGEEAVLSVSDSYDLYIVDIDIPNVNGLEILEHIRNTYKKIPIIIISATIDMEMITQAYTKGCSDYLKKPFDIKELELKIRAFTRDIDKDISLYKDLTYNKDDRELTYNKESILLSAQESILISILVDNIGKLVLNESLESAVWGLQTPHLRQLISRIRKKIPVEFIQTRVGEGYFIK